MFTPGTKLKTPSLFWTVRTLAFVLCVGASAACGPAPAASTGSTTGSRELLDKSRLGVFMKSLMNPPFSKVSFLLFHNEEEPAPGTDPLLEILKATNDLAEASRALAQWEIPPTESDEARTVFIEYAQNLQRDVQSLQQALASKDVAKAQQVFEELRRKCDSCHHFFRYQGDVSAALELPPIQFARALGDRS